MRRAPFVRSFAYTECPLTGETEIEREANGGMGWGWGLGVWGGHGDRNSEEGKKNE